MRKWGIALYTTSCFFTSRRQSPKSRGTSGLFGLLPRGSFCARQVGSGCPACRTFSVEAPVIIVSMLCGEHSKKKKLLKFHRRVFFWTFQCASSWTAVALRRTRANYFYILWTTIRTFFVRPRQDLDIKEVGVVHRYQYRSAHLCCSERI